VSIPVDIGLIDLREILQDTSRFGGKDHAFALKPIH
jgi:hypothetical protein